MRPKMIDEEWIDNQITELENLQLRPEFNKTEEAKIGLSSQIGVFNEIKRQLQPLTPLIKDAFLAGQKVEYKDISFDGGDTYENVAIIQDVEEYLSQNNYE